MQLKANLHLHSSEDPADGHAISYSFKEAIDRAHALGFEVLAITLHHIFGYTNELAQYAAGKSILLIPGIELSVEGRHVLVLNCDKDVEEVKTFDDLRRYRQTHANIFVMAPHPYYPILSLQGALGTHRELFDAVEQSWFYTKFIDRNRPAREFAQKHQLPYVATSDTHILKNLNRSYALVEAEEKTIPAFFAALKAGRVHNVARPLSLLNMSAHALFMVLWFNVHRIILRLIGRLPKQQRTPSAATEAE